MSLPAAWVDRIFAKLTTVYGRDFLSRWEGLDLAVVKADWAHELSGFFTHPDAVSYALQNLPEKPPSVVEFKRLARSARTPDVPQLELAVKADPERIAAALQRLQDSRKGDRWERQWAYDLLADHERGNRRPMACVEMARRGIGADAPAPEAAWD